MRRAAQRVLSGGTVASLLCLAGACSSPFEGGAQGAAGAAGSAGTATAGGAAGSEAGSAGRDGTGGASGASGASGGSGAAAAAGGNGGSAAGGGSPEPGAGAGGGGNCKLELLANGHFDDIDSSWTQSAMPERSLIVHQSANVLEDAGIAPVSAEYLLLLGGVNSDESSISQTIQVPESTLSLIVSGYIRIISLEAEDQAWDSLIFELTTEASEPEPFADYSNLDHNDEWTPFSFLLDRAPYLGQAATLRITSDSDDNTLTSFLLDSLSVTAVLCDD